MRTRNRFTRHQRLRRSEDFAAVFDTGQVVSDATLVVHAVPSPGSPTRLGLSVSKRVGNAPLRNRWKRMIREAFRLSYSKLPTEMTIVVRPRKDARPKSSDVAESLLRLTKRVAKRLRPS
ncbi:MAG: ribonuclease P protein component [Pirellulales bacterium]